MTPALRITARRAGFRRAGLAHPAEPVVHAAGTFTPGQVAALLAEPNLVVVPLSAVPTNGGEAAPASSQGDALTEAATAADHTAANAGDQAVAGTHAQGEGQPDDPAASASAAEAVKGAGSEPAAEGSKPAANPAEGAADAPAVPTAKPTRKAR